MSPLLIVGHRLTPHGLHHRPLTARLSVIMICLPHIRVREKRVYDTDVIFRWSVPDFIDTDLGCQVG